jgi:integrase
MKIEILKTDSGQAVRCGHAIVRIAPVTRGKYTTFRLAWKVGRKTFRRGFNDEVKALSEAERIARSLANADGAATTIAGDEIVYLNECRKKLGDIPLHVAVDFYLRHNGTTKSDKTLNEAWAEFIQESETRELSVRHIETCRYHRKAIGTVFGERRVSNIQPTEIGEWLNSGGYSAKTRLNMFRSFASVLRYSRRKGYTNRIVEDLISEVQIASPKQKTPTFYTPEELKKLFIACPNKESVLYVAMMAFSGTRRAEYARLEGKFILPEEKMIRLGPEITKTSSGRALDIADNLAQWLNLAWDGRKGLLLTSGDNAKTYKWTFEGLEMETKQNALRHSFCSYHLAMHRNAAMTAEIAGNSPTMLNKFYKALVSKKDAEEWFSITPQSVKAYAAEKALEKLITW